MEILKKIWRAFLNLVADPKPPASTNRLYVIHVDFAMDAKAIDELDALMAHYRNKFGLDFIVLEPGIKLSKFDNIQ